MKQYFATASDCYKAGKKLKPRGVMLHATGANNPNLKRYVGPDDGLLGKNKYNNHWNRPGVKKCAHAFIGLLADGSLGAYQLLPFTMRGWHCGGKGNNTHIGIELCQDKMEDKTYFTAIFDLAVEEVAAICLEFDLDPLKDGVLLDHREAHARGLASNHADVRHWFSRFGVSMDDFRRQVSRKLEEIRQNPTNAEEISITLPLLRKGDRGETVRALQALLLLRGEDLASYGADGSFGGVTQKALRSFQQKASLPATGETDESTWLALLTGAV
jgi:N-acetylmuramoyl-L-alanine amidase